jgi:DsbC/DsbD-like thiol-disulfide interchange protein
LNSTLLARQALILSGSMFVAMVIGACGNSGFGPGHAKASLLSEKRTVARGSNALFGVRFDIEPGWHLYWNGQNDTGYAPHVTFELPEGFRAGNILWPVPRRLVSPGNILDHVYENHVTLLVPITVPAEAKPGRYVLKGEATWLACHDVCVPGKEALQLTVSVGGEAEAAQLNKEIEETKATLPLGWGEANRAVAIESTWQDGILILRRPGASGMVFFPDTASVAIRDLLHAGEVTGEEMRLVPQDSTGQISGILGIQTPGDTIYSSFKQTLPQKP